MMNEQEKVFLKPKQCMNLPPKILVWYDRSLRMWTATYRDDSGNQLYSAGYGVTKKEAIEDVQYQKNLEEAKSARH